MPANVETSYPRHCRATRANDARGRDWMGVGYEDA
jgi:hypothetical protein